MSLLMTIEKIWLSYDYPNAKWRTANSNLPSCSWASTRKDSEGGRLSLSEDESDGSFSALQQRTAIHPMATVSTLDNSWLQQLYLLPLAHNQSQHLTSQHICARVALNWMAGAYHINGQIKYCTLLASVDCKQHVNKLFNRMQTFTSQFYGIL